MNQYTQLITGTIAVNQVLFPVLKFKKAVIFNIEITALHDNAPGRNRTCAPGLGGQCSIPCATGAMKQHYPLYKSRNKMKRNNDGIHIFFCKKKGLPTLYRYNKNNLNNRFSMIE